MDLVKNVDAPTTKYVESCKKSVQNKERKMRHGARMRLSENERIPYDVFFADGIVRIGEHVLNIYIYIYPTLNFMIAICVTDTHSCMRIKRTSPWREHNCVRDVRKRPRNHTQISRRIEDIYPPPLPHIYNRRRMC